MYRRLMSLEEIIQTWIISTKDINDHYIYKVYCRENEQYLLVVGTTKKDSFGTSFLKKISFLASYGFFKKLELRESIVP